MGEDEIRLIIPTRNRELTIYEDTKVALIKNKSQYTKLILKKYVNLKAFPNVKEVAIDYKTFFDKRLDLSNINKVILLQSRPDAHFKNVNEIKSIELTEKLEELNRDFINIAIEEIIFNVTKIFDLNSIRRAEGVLSLVESRLKRIIIKYKDLEFKIEPDYKLNYINDIHFNNIGNIILKYGNDYISTSCKINSDKIIKKNYLKAIDDELLKGSTLYIPDYITQICINNKNTPQEIDKISLSLENIKDSYVSKSFDEVIDFNNIKQIQVRNNNEMALFKSRIYGINKYGKILNLAISNCKLYIMFENFTIVIDKDGDEIKVDNNSIEIKNIFEDTVVNSLKTTNNIDEKVELPISKCTTQQLKLYTSFRDILEYISNNDDKDLCNSLDVVENRLIKKFKGE